MSSVLAAIDPTEQARPLSVEEVKRLKWMLANTPNKLDQYLVGCMLFALYPRSRWSDVGNLQSFFFDIIETDDGPFGFADPRKIQDPQNFEHPGAQGQVHALGRNHDRDWSWSLGSCVGRRP